MPYSTPHDHSPSSSPPRHLFQHRRTRSSGAFSDERGPGAFVSLGSLPRSHKRAVFHINVPDDDLDDRPRSALSPRSSLRLSMNAGTFSPSIEPPPRIDIPPPAPTSVPFPTSSPLSPTDRNSPFIPSSSTSRTSLPRTPSTPVILSNGKPLKPSLKSSSSSPNIQGLAPHRAHFRAQSAPSTPVGPKNVHFAENDEGLATVRVFSRSGKPASLSVPPGEETETETEAESSAQPPSSFPFPSLSSSEPVIYEIDSAVQRTSPVPAPSPSPYANVHLETLALPRTHPPALRGTVLVRNIAFQKAVAVRFTLDDWQTTSEVLCRHVVSLPSLPPPFPHPRTLGDVAGSIASGSSPEKEEQLVPTWDRFSFVIRLEDYAYKLGERTLFLAARYNPGSGGEWWDNNAGANFRVAFRRAPAPSSSARTFEGSLGLAGMGLGMGLAIQAHASPTHAQQRTFSPPSTLRATPPTGDPGPPSGLTLTRPAAPPALARSHSSPFPVATSPPPPSRVVQPEASHPSSPVLRFVAKRLSLSNYAAPAPVTVIHDAEPQEQEQERGKEREQGAKIAFAGVDGEMVTPPLTPPGSVRVRRKALVPPASEVQREPEPKREAASPPRELSPLELPAAALTVSPEGSGSEEDKAGEGASAKKTASENEKPGMEMGMLSPPSSPVRGLGLQIEEHEQEQGERGHEDIFGAVDGVVGVRGAEHEGGRYEHADAEERDREHEARDSGHLDDDFGEHEHEEHEEEEHIPDADHDYARATAAPAPPSPFQSDSSYAALIRQWCFGGASLSPAPSPAAATPPPNGNGVLYGARAFGYPSSVGFGFPAAPDAGMVGGECSSSPPPSSVLEE
ncbi:putative phosphatase regulatory subunit-domain-containing protein [Sparassis latifolia]